MITSDYGRSASDPPHPRTPAAQRQLAAVSATSSHRCGPVSAWVHTASPHRRCAQVPTPINFDDPVFFGDKVLFCFACDDVGMRNMAVVALTDAGVQGKQVAAAFGLSAEYVSILRGRARTDGSAGLVRRRGRPPKLTAGQVAKARRWAAEGSPRPRSRGGCRCRAR